jgi:AcrR family transcriptional regulator
MLTESGRSLTPRAGLREVLLETADRLMRERGARGLTTREIAREAGCSEGALYVHFQDKEHLLSATCERWLPDLVGAVGSLVERIGTGTVRENLEAIARSVVRAFEGMVPSMQAIAGDPDLLRHYQVAMRAAGLGPQKGIQAIGAYLAAEQRLGRIRGAADPEMAASLLLAACWQRVTVRSYFGADALPMDDDTYVAGVAGLLTSSLEPGRTP